jgi:hypothetical protein
MYAWRPIPPDDNFVTLGMVVTTTPKMPALNLVRCVPRGTILFQCLPPPFFLLDTIGFGIRGWAVWICTMHIALFEK